MPATRTAAFSLWTNGGICLAIGLGLSTNSTGVAASVTAYRGQIAIPTYPWSAVKHPYFRGTDKVNIYPYPMLDNLSRTKESRVWQTVVLENEYLRVTFLPALGGKIYDVLDKTTGQPMFYVNHVVKPGLIGQCGAWVSGGIEWNTGPQGHTVSAVQPVDVVILPPAPDGSRSVAVGETERIYQTRWTVVVTLRPGRSFLEESIRIYNATDTVRPYYFWNCTAMPNTPGFRFIYPMTLGTDHAGKTFYSWPISEGKDLGRGTNYQDASSIFAYECDQDFFGSYDDQANRGVVAYANHHQVPGKKAWTWGQGSFGAMHQMDLTDTDGPYNEVQTGPLPTQADVGRLEPHETVNWQEWWYPVHDLGGFTFANRDVAANATLEKDTLDLRLIGTGEWGFASIEVFNSEWKSVGVSSCRLDPRRAAKVRILLNSGLVLPVAPLRAMVRVGSKTLADFQVPLDLPVRMPPSKKEAPASAAELAQDGWQQYLFAHLPEAESKFRKTLEKEPDNMAARLGLGYLWLDQDTRKADEQAQAVLRTDPDCGPAHLLRASAQYRLAWSGQGKESVALEEAWKAALDPATAVPARALAAKLMIRQSNYVAAASALAEPGPWQTDPVCQDLRAFACLATGRKRMAVELASATLAVEPLDAFARSVLWLAQAEKKGMRLADLMTQDTAGAPARTDADVARQSAQSGLDLAIEYSELGQAQTGLRILQEFYLNPNAGKPLDPIVSYWAALLAQRLGQGALSRTFLKQAQAQPGDWAFPIHWQSVQPLAAALAADPNDGKAALCLGHLQFALGRHEQGRELWRKAVKLEASPAIALRALGMANLNLDHDPAAARAHLKQAHDLAPTDAIIARDLARVLFSLADKAEERVQKTPLLEEIEATLKTAFNEGRTRSDYVTLLARTQNRLGKHAEAAKLLDTVRVTIWEGGREVHDLFEDAHLALGNEHLSAGRNREALAEFNRALEYPANLATGKMENVREAHIYYLRGNALAALGDTPGAIAAWKKAGAERGGNARQTEARQRAKAALAKVGVRE